MFAAVCLPRIFNPHPTNWDVTALASRTDVLRLFAICRAQGGRWCNGKNYRGCGVECVCIENSINIPTPVPAPNRHSKVTLQTRNCFRVQQSRASPLPFACWPSSCRRWPGKDGSWVLPVGGGGGKQLVKVVRPASAESQLAAALMGGVGCCVGAARVLLAPAICLSACLPIHWPHHPIWTNSTETGF